jgi:D-alanyl-D-alanine carboxypeptidase (penicillin-binding protein 5/6)
MSKTRIFVVATPVVALLLGGLQVGRALPPARIGLTHEQLTVPGSLSPAFPTQGQSAIGEASLGVAAETPNQEPVAIASLTKMMTAYLLLQAQPLELGEDGPVTTVTAADVAEYQRDRAEGYSVLKVSAGEKLTERQLLEGLMLPSGDNVATMIARQVAGSEAAFVAKMNEAARSLGMTQTTYKDAAGVSNATVSTAHDQVLIAMAVMKNRVLRDIVRQPQATLPAAGTVYNVNFLVGKRGVSGVKTGSTLAAGSCFVGSFPFTGDGKPRLLFAAVLGQPSLKQALTLDADLLNATAPKFKTYAIDAPREGLAQLTTPWKEVSDLRAAKPLRIFGYPGMPVGVAATVTHPAMPITGGQTVATLTLTAGQTTETVGLKALDDMDGPNPLWRLVH